MAETKEAVKPLKIEVHATAMHHEQLIPKVAHSQTHDFGHNQAVSRPGCSFFAPLLPCITLRSMFCPTDGAARIVTMITLFLSPL